MGRRRSRSRCSASFLRLWKLGTPHEFAFDETYYAKDAWSLLHYGYVRRLRRRTPTTTILAGQTDGLWTGDPSMIVHPEVGKWLIALGEQRLRDGPRSAGGSPRPSSAR